MRIVIDIPDDKYKEICSGNFETDGYFKMNLRNAFINGTPLSKGHGDLIDRSELKEHLYACEINGRPFYTMELHERLAVIDEVDAVIEADKEGDRE